MRAVELSAPASRDVLKAAGDIVAAFAATDTARYFAGFAPDATFAFHSEPTRLESRKEYETLWQGWLLDGWRVLACESANPSVTTFPGGAVFIHDVSTTVHTAQGQESYQERETIVFRQDPDGALTAIHEHLSPIPTSAP